MLTVNVSSNNKKLSRSLDTLGRKQLPFAFAKTLNEIMKAVEKYTVQRSKGLPTIKDFPTDPIEIECKNCGRNGRYLKAALIEKYGSDIVLSDLLGPITGARELRGGLGN